MDRKDVTSSQDRNHGDRNSGVRSLVSRHSGIQ